MTGKKYNSADENDVAKAKRNQHNDIKAEIKDLRATMSTSSGRRTIWNLLAKCGVFRSCFNTDNNIMSFNEGKRDVGLQYMTLLHEHCHDDYLVMEREHKQLEAKRG